MKTKIKDQNGEYLFNGEEIEVMSVEEENDKPKEYHTNLICSCGSELVLSEDDYLKEKNGKSYKFYNARILKCIKCEKKFESDIFYMVSNFAIEQLEKDFFEKQTFEINFDAVFNTLINNPYEIIPKVKFEFDKKDYYFIPGLVRPHNEGFLTPVFFNLEVLLKYSYHPTYSLEIGSNTYSTIYKNKIPIISFGINSNDKVVMWLGDIDKLDEKEQWYLKSENINSDHQLQSEFYDAQIHVKWPELNNESKLLRNRFEFNEKVLREFKFSLSHLIPETIKAAKKIKRPIVSTEEAFSQVIIALNMVINESINSKDIKINLNEFFNSKREQNKLQKLGGMKAFGIWLEKRLNISQESVDKIMCPMFALYDLRIVCAHLQSEDKSEELYKYSLRRLEIEETCNDFIRIYDIITVKLMEAFEKLNGISF